MRNRRRPRVEGGIFVNVVDMIDLCTASLVVAERNHDTKLEAAARSVMSALMLHVGSRHAELPPELRKHYDYLTGVNK